MDSYFKKFLILIVLAVAAYFALNYFWKKSPETYRECSLQYIQEFGDKECENIMEARQTETDVVPDE
ncbi:hypothetical protein H0V99_03625 [Candidatus Saccharibacteria bacterium]|nr:hypothetical protein [Candidatus Saccharibacteria bacterium]